MKTLTGLDQLAAEQATWAKKIKGRLGYLCHGASITSDHTSGVVLLKKIFGARLVKLFGPQHGLLGDLQDNMKESPHFEHPYFKLPVLSLYGETRTPTPEMLEGIETLIIDLQDVGTRVYTYITTLGMAMEACGKLDIEVVVLDRPNPIGGECIEGNILDPSHRSFVGRYPIPMRHAMTMGEIARFGHQFTQDQCELRVIPLKNWRRSQFFSETGLSWVPPSPNLPSLNGTIAYAGAVIFEGTNISEGRGTTLPFETLGHPDIEPWSWAETLREELADTDLGRDGLFLRPCSFRPTFHKHSGKTCGGLQLVFTRPTQYHSWALGQFLCRQFYLALGKKFAWSEEPYEYVHDQLAFDVINGSDQLRLWVEGKGEGKGEGGGSWAALKKLEQQGRDTFMGQRDDCLLY